MAPVLRAIRIEIWPARLLPRNRPTTIAYSFQSLPPTLNNLHRNSTTYTKFQRLSPAYIRGEFGIRLEDGRHITENGARLFTPQSPSLEDPFGKA